MRISATQKTEEIILCFIKQGYASVECYLDGFPVPQMNHYDIPLLKELTRGSQTTSVAKDE